MTDADFDPSELDPGIRDLVVHLRSHGFDTRDSGDGVSKGDRGQAWPHVAIWIGDSISDASKGIPGALAAASIAAVFTGRAWSAQLSAGVEATPGGEFRHEPSLILLVDTERFLEAR